MKPKTEYVYKTTLSKDYGLTPSLIKELGEPDKYVVNPHYRSGPEASLYLVERVESWIEANKGRVDKVRAIRATRSQAAKKVHEAKRNEKRKEALGWVRQAHLALEPLPEDLLEQTRRHFNIADEVAPTEKQLKSFVRHELTAYDSLRKKVKEIEWWLRDELYQDLRCRVDRLAEDALAKWEQEHFAISV